MGAILDKSDENKSNDGVFRAIYSSQSDIKKKPNIDNQFVKKSDKVRASLEKLGTAQCKIKTEDSLIQKKVVNVAESGISVSNFSTDPADVIRQQLDIV